MQKIILAVILLMITVPAYSQMGYSRDPWGSNTWTGPGRPPHWGPTQRKHSRPPHYRPPGPGHPTRPGHRPPVYVRPEPFPEKRYREYKTENSQSRNSTVYRRSGINRFPPNAVKCSGTTRTSLNAAGQPVIEYVSSARDCAR